MKVTVLVMTFNHERFVGRALESALAQEADFDFEVLVSEDCSTDRTREIVRSYHLAHPGRVRLLLSERNMRSNEVVRRGIRGALGEYVALLDGDDYWTSTAKLRSQVRFLDAHPECSLCFHNALVVHDDGSREPWLWVPAGQKEVSTLDDIWRGNFVPTCSAMFRRDRLTDIPDWYVPMFPITDWPLHILAAERGPIGYLDDVMGVYRQHAGGLYSVHSEERKQLETLAFYHRMNENLGYRYDRVVRAAIFNYFVEWAEEYERRGELAPARRCLRQALSARHLASPRALARTGSLAARLHVWGRLARGSAGRAGRSEAACR